MQRNRKLALDSELQTYQILTNDDEVYIPCLSSILLAVIIPPITVDCETNKISAHFEYIKFIILTRICSSSQ